MQIEDYMQESFDKSHWVMHDMASYLIYGPAVMLSYIVLTKNLYGFC